MKGIGKLLDKKYGELCFGLFCGISYFAIVLQFILANTARSGGLLAFFFFPAIICFIALAVIKIIRDMREKERYKSINLFMWVHLIIFLIAVTVLIELIV